MIVQKHMQKESIDIFIWDSIIIQVLVFDHLNPERIYVCSDMR